MNTMNEITGKALERVRKMLTLANDAAASEGERDNALRMAHATLAKYNLTLADAEAHGAKSDDPRRDVNKEYYCWPWMRQAAFAVAELFFCRFFFARSRKNFVKYWFIGRASNTTTAVEMVDYVIASITKEANAHRSRGGDWLSFCKGASQRISERCAILRAEAERASQQAVAPGMSLVLASVYRTELDANMNYLRDVLKIKLKTSVARTRSANSDDWHAGRAAGDKINLHRQLDGQRSAAGRITIRNPLPD